MKGLYAFSKELALEKLLFLILFFYLQYWVLSSGTDQSFIAIMDSRHIYHTVSPQEVIDFFFLSPFCVQ